MILDIYKDSLEYGVKDGVILLKLGLMFILSIFILPIFLILGYDYRIIKTAINGQINGDDSLPSMDDLISMFVDGLKLFVVNIVYLIVPIAVFLGLGFLGNTLVKSSPVAGQIIQIIAIVLSLVLAVIAYVLMNLAFSRLAETDSLSEAFNFKELWKTAGEIGWLRLIGFFLGLIIIISVLTFIVSLILIIVIGILTGTVVFIAPISFLAGGVLSAGFILIYLVIALFVAPYISLVQFRAIGLVYNLRF